jgi:peptidoglycan/LPS O-acetylase OafA/YrhL
MAVSNQNQRLSNAITWLRFPLIFLIILLHCYSVQRLEGSHETYFKALYPFSLWLGETGVPGFFFISGFLFFLSKKTYFQKLHTRVHTLLIPYLLWNLILLILYLAAWAAGYPQNINGRSITDYTVMDYLRLFWDRGSYDNGNFVPLLCPLWYIRNLLIMSILSPILYYIIRYTREAFILAITIWWLISYHNAFIPQTILFFSLGAYFSIFDINLLQMIHKQKKIFFIIFTFFAISDIVSHTIYHTPVNLQIHRLSLIFNIPALLILADWSIQRGYNSRLLPNAAFIVFCVHYPIVVALRKICIAQFANATDSIHILFYFVCVIISTLLSIGLYLLMDKYLPTIKRILSGNR